MKVIVFFLLGLLIVSAVFIIIHTNQPKKDTSTTKEYQGPVRPTDDGAYFRKTGITKPLESG